MLAALPWTLVASLSVLGSQPPPAAPSPSPSPSYPTFSRPGSLFNRAAVDPGSGRVYVGAVNHLYQLPAELRGGPEAVAVTGPVNDSRDCLPPIRQAQCPAARPTAVHSQLLLVDVAGGALLACGSALRGLCQKRALGSLPRLLEREEHPGETQYVAADRPGTATVAALAAGRTLVVGRGYAHRPTDPPVSTRRLDGPHPFSNEDLGRLVVPAGGFADYDHRFVAAFSRSPHVYLLFNRRDPRGRHTPPGAYRAYLARLCDRDPSYYSYAEVPLACGPAAGGEGPAQSPPLAVASTLDAPASTLFVAFARPQPPPHRDSPSDRTAVCSYPLATLDRAVERARQACYSSHHTDEARVEYDVKSGCTRLPKDSPTIFPCGEEHTPSPIAGTVPVQGEPLLNSSVLLTAVAVAAEDNSTVVFLGDRLGKLHKVFQRPAGQGVLYSSLTIQHGSPVNKDLLFDPAREHIYVMTTSQLVRVPVAECSQYSDCTSCLGARDPYCGWCVLEGRCSRRRDCGRSQEPNHWLWVYKRNEQCPSVLSKVPGSLSRHERREVQLTVGGLPALRRGEELACWFGELLSPAIVQGNVVRCQTPAKDRVPPSHPGKDHVSLELTLRFRQVTVAATEFLFYDCSRVPQLRPASPCRACVTSPWKCSWCLGDHRCVDAADCAGGHAISSQKEEMAVRRGPDHCPRVERMEGSALIPLGQRRALTMTARNLDLLGDDQPYQCVVGTQDQPTVMRATVQRNTDHPRTFHVTCEATQFELSAQTMETEVPVFLQQGIGSLIDSPEDLKVSLYDCRLGQADCSRCQVLDVRYDCVWCGGEVPACRYRQSCPGAVMSVCPPPVIQQVNPGTAPIEGGTSLTIVGTDLGKRFQDIEHSVTVAGLPCVPDPEGYCVSTRIVCTVSPSTTAQAGPVKVSVGDRPPATSAQSFTYQDPQLISVFPERGPIAGGTRLTITGSHLLTGGPGDISVYLGPHACPLEGPVGPSRIVCLTSPSREPGPVGVRVGFGRAHRLLDPPPFHYTENPRVRAVQPRSSFYSGGRLIHVDGEGLDVVQQPLMVVHAEGGARSPRGESAVTPGIPLDTPQLSQYSDSCTVSSATHMRCQSPRVPPGSRVVAAAFLLDNLVIDFGSAAGGSAFEYCPDPSLRALHSGQPSDPYTYKPGSVLSVEGEHLDLAMKMEEVQAFIGEEPCQVKTLTRHNLYCVPPKHQPPAAGVKRDGGRDLPEFVVLMGNLRFSLGRVQYETDGRPSFPLEAKVGLAVGAAVVVLLVGVVILIYRKKSKKAVRDYKKVLVQLVNLETSVGDQCRREFTDLMTEMMDLTGDLEGTRIPFRDYRAYAERMFFPGYRESPLSRELDVPEPRRLAVEQGLQQLSNLLNSKAFLIKLVQTLEDQGTFTPRDRGYVASLITVALHGKLEYLTDITTSLLSDLVAQYVAKNPKLMLRRTETVVEKLLTNWISICHYTFLRDTAGEPLYTLVRAIKHQVDKGPVDEVSGKAKYTLNDSRLLQEAVEYKLLTLNVLMKDSEAPAFPAKVLDVDTIDQAKEKILDQIHKGTPFSQRPAADSLNLEWRAGVGGHLTLSNEDVTSELQGQWKRLNTLLHYKVPDGATVALVPRVPAAGGKEQGGIQQPAGEKAPMLEDGEEGAVRYWHLVKPAEEPDVPEQKRGNIRERERAKAIPEIYLTRLLSMKGIHQKFVDDVFQAILSASRPMPLAVKYYFDFLDQEAARHGIVDPETLHIWKTNSLPLRFWLTILKNPQLTFDLQLSDKVDAALSVIAQTFMDSCTTGEHKVGRDSPINKLLYAKEIPRYRQMVEKYYADIQHMGSVSYQEMNSALTELSGNSLSEVHTTVALHELYKYISKYYSQVISALEEDFPGPRMQLAFRLQQIAALVENKVTDL